jgi:hypothetical protein
MGRYIYEDGFAGRPKVPINHSPPKDFSRLDALMLRLDDRGWCLELAKRQRFEALKANPPPHRKGQPIRDPFEMDQVMCRAYAVAECKDETDLEVARFNKRIVVEIDPNCPDNLIIKQITAILDQTRKRHARQINTKHWTEHRILVLYDLELMGYDRSKNRKQLAQWLLPKISSQKAQGDKFDRAKRYLDKAKDQLPALRAQLSS